MELLIGEHCVLPEAWAIGDSCQDLCLAIAMSIERGQPHSYEEVLLTLAVGATLQVMHMLNANSPNDRSLYESVKIARLSRTGVSGVSHRGHLRLFTFCIHSNCQRRCR